MERHRGAERFVNTDRKNENRYVRALTEKGKRRRRNEKIADIMESFVERGGDDPG